MLSIVFRMLALIVSGIAIVTLRGLQEEVPAGLANL